MDYFVIVTPLYLKITMCIKNINDECVFFLYFSATWPEGVRRLGSSYLKDPIQVFVGSLDLAVSHSLTGHTVELYSRELFFGSVNIAQS